MVKKGMFVDILIQFKQGDSIRKIARDAGLSRNTVRKYIRNDTSLPVYHVKLNKLKRCLYLDEFENYIKSRI